MWKIMDKVEKLYDAIKFVNDWVEYAERGIDKGLEQVIAEKKVKPLRFTRKYKCNDCNYKCKVKMSIGGFEPKVCLITERYVTWKCLNCYDIINKIVPDEVKHG